MVTRILQPGETGEIICEFCHWPFTYTGDESGMQPIYCPSCATVQQCIKRQIARSEESNLVAKITLVVRKADQAFEISGGSTRHWVRDCFLPALKEAGLWIAKSVTEDEQG